MKKFCHCAIDIAKDSEFGICKEFIQKSEFRFIFYNSQSYRYRHSVVLTEVSRVDSTTLVPFVATMSRKFNKMLDSKIDPFIKDEAYEVLEEKIDWFSEEYVSKETNV